MARSYTWLRLCLMLLVMFALVVLGCNADEDRLSSSIDVHLLPMSYPIQFWHIDFYNLQGKRIFQTDVELLDSASNDLERPVLSMLEVVDGSSGGHFLHVVNGQNPGNGAQYPLLRFPTAPPSFWVSVYDSNGDIVLAYETQGGMDVFSGVGSMLENGVYFYRMFVKIVDEWVLTVVRKLVVLR